MKLGINNFKHLRCLKMEKRNKRNQEERQKHQLCSSKVNGRKTRGQILFSSCNPGWFSYSKNNLDQFIFLKKTSINFNENKRTFR